MSTANAVSLISAVVASVSVFFSGRATIDTARLTNKFEEARRRASKEEQVEELMSRYREPLLRAAFDLQSRIYNIIKLQFLIRYGGQGTEHEREYAGNNTMFLLAEYFGWVEILRRDVQFLDLGDVERNRLLVERLETISDAFATDQSTSDPTFRIFRGEQRAIGEVMIHSPAFRDTGSRRECIGYAEFCRQMREVPSFAEWFGPLRDDVSGADER